MTPPRDLQAAAFLAWAEAVPFEQIEAHHHQRNTCRWLDFHRRALEAGFKEVKYEQPDFAIADKAPVYDAKTGEYIGHFPVAPYASIMVKIPEES